MKEIYVFCEGATEQGFCAAVLQPSLFPTGVGLVHTIRTAHSRRHGIVSRGGVGKYAPLRRDILNALKMNRRPDVFFTTMIDLYGLRIDFPGKADHWRNPADPTPYVEALEAAFAADIDDERFIPHLQLHEFETLLFAQPDALLPSFENCQAAIDGMKAIAAKFGDVELIDDGVSTSPSKRIDSLLPEYSGRKASVGPEIAQRIGLKTLRDKCPHFNAWIERLEQVLGDTD